MPAKRSSDGGKDDAPLGDLSVPVCANSGAELGPGTSRAFRSRNGRTSRIASRHSLRSSVGLTRLVVVSTCRRPTAFDKNDMETPGPVGTGFCGLFYVGGWGGSGDEVDYPRQCV